MKSITSASTPILTSMNSPTQAQQINSMEVSPSKTQSTPRTSNDTIARSSQQNTVTINVVTKPTAAELKEGLLDLVALEKEQQKYAGDMVSETQRILAEVAKEQPNLLNKKFDFTNTGDEIDIIDHDLTKREYNYLKAKLNASDKLVEATDFLNMDLAREKTQTSRSNTIYTKEDVVGRIHVRDIIEQAQQRSTEFTEIHDRNFVMKPNDNRALYRKEDHLNALDIVLNTSVRFNAKV
ncbi:hypothetical protein [Colwellia ponticola]|uniref:Uncharacterized protein n=1 Tax=Colwellia ponticola TaxID=2304625 RepID=A0A8H2JLJ0_9GAMM|nr:hypothetical protein [Colwellia ponticola]TMM45790.1 hypothetical protein FCS21_08220 [Colwellia ponticola]